MAFTYTPDDDIQVHEEGAIRLICSSFQSHEAGLPEWIKNSADEYARADAPAARRVVVVLLQNGRGRIAPSISILDFSGMTSAVIENNFRIWADPEAARRGFEDTVVQGGHGNGGKCYMTMMFEDHAYIHSVKNGVGCRYGVQSGSVQFGYIPGRAEGRSFEVPTTLDELTTALSAIGTAVDALPPEALEALALGDGFTLVTGRRPKGYGNRIPAAHLVDSLVDHPQMVRAIDFCDVHVLVNGAVLARANPLALEAVTPDPAFPGPPPIDIPAELIDPESDQRVSTTDEGRLEPGTLVLRTSDVSMRYSRRGRHSIVYRARSGYIGYVPVRELDVQSPYRDRIYGECSLLSLESAKQNERARLANSPLSRAVEAFISTKVQELAREFETRDERTYDQEEKNALSRINDALDRWKNQFMTHYLEGLWGPGGDVNPPPPQPPLPSGIPTRIEVSLSHSRGGVGVSFRPTIQFFDLEGRRIRAVPYSWSSDDTNVAWVDPDLNVINTFAPGVTTISATALDGRVTSNQVRLKVVDIQAISLVPHDLEVPMGSRRSIEARCTLRDGDSTTDAYLVWTESDPSVARVSAAGAVFGFSIGKTDVAAGDDRCLATDPVPVHVVAASATGDGDRRGHGFPRILVSGGVDPDPETGDTINFSRDDPPVAQRPQDVDRNIWWINSAAPFAEMYLDQSRGYGYSSREWRIYHLERLIDVMVQIALVSDPDFESLSAADWLLLWGQRVAEIQSAAASSLGNFIASGNLPGGED